MEHLCRSKSCLASATYKTAGYTKSYFFYANITAEHYIVKEGMLRESIMPSLKNALNGSLQKMYLPPPHIN